nr:hypothetical protein [Sandarakinorhabdus sp.]
MSADVQQLLLRIDASTELARRELARVAAPLDEVDRRVRRTQDGMGGLDAAFGKVKDSAAGFIAALSVGAVAGFAKSVLDFADDLGTAADQAGVAVERYQTLREGLRALEISGESTDKILKRLNDTLGAVQGGTASAGLTAALDKLGVTSRIINGDITTTDQLLDALAEGAKNFATEAQFTAAIVEVVGRKLGVDLAAALKDGGSALKQQEQAFRDSGAVIDRELIQKLADANERIDSFVSTSKSRLTVWAGDLLDILERAGRGWDRFFDIPDLNSRSGLITENMKAQAELRRLQEGTFGFLPVAPQAIRNQERYIADIQRRLRAQEVADPTITDPLSRLFPLNPNGTFGRSPPPPPPPKKDKGSGVDTKKREPTLNELRQGGFETVKDVLRQEKAPSVLSQMPLIEFPEPPSLIDNEGLAAAKAQLAEIATLAGQVPTIKAVTPEVLEISERFNANLAQGLAQAIVQGQSLGDALVNSLKAAAAELIASGLLKLLGGALGGGGIIGAIGSLLGFADG